MYVGPVVRLGLQVQGVRHRSMGKSVSIEVRRKQTLVRSLVCRYGDSGSTKAQQPVLVLSQSPSLALLSDDKIQEVRPSTNRPSPSQNPKGDKVLKEKMRCVAGFAKPSAKRACLGVSYLNRHT